MLFTSRTPPLSYTLALERGLLKHVRHRYAGEYYFHPRTLAYASLIMLPALRDEFFIGNAGFVSAVIQKHMGSLYLDIGYCSLHRDFNLALIIVFRHKTLNTVQKIFK